MWCVSLSWPTRLSSQREVLNWRPVAIWKGKFGFHCDWIVVWTHPPTTISVSAYDCTIAAGDKAIVLTDLAIEVPAGCYGRVAPRSGLAAKHGIDVGAGVIDEDYRGNIGVILFNHGKEAFVVKRGDRIAQLICERIVYPVLEEVEKLTATERGAGGFGSTGTNWDFFVCEFCNYKLFLFY